MKLLCRINEIMFMKYLVEYWRYSNGLINYINVSSCCNVFLIWNGVYCKVMSFYYRIFVRINDFILWSYRSKEKVWVGLNIFFVLLEIILLEFKFLNYFIFEYFYNMFILFLIFYFWSLFIIWGVLEIMKNFDVWG